MPNLCILAIWSHKNDQGFVYLRYPLKYLVKNAVVVVVLVTKSFVTVLPRVENAEDVELGTTSRECVGQNYVTIMMAVQISIWKLV